MSSQIVPQGYKQTKVGVIPTDWNAIELEKLLTFKNGINASKEQYGTGYKFINVLDIINNLVINHNNIIGLVNITEKEFKLYEVRYGDILFQRSSETREEVGQSNIYFDKNKTAVFGGFVIRGTPKQKYNPIYMNYLLKIQIIRKQIISRSGGSTRYNIGQNSLNQVIIPLSPLKEQQKIAKILTTWDDAISKQDELIKAKEKLKKGLMQKLLSGEVRFGGFIGEWEEKKLGNICKITTGKLNANAMVENGKYAYFTCARNIYKIDKFAFNTEALLISGNGANVGYIHYYKGKFNAYQRTYVLDSFVNNIIFIKYILDKYLAIQIGREKNDGNTPYITLPTLTTMKIKLPSIKEQQKIVEVLSNADKEIDLLKNEFQELKEQKKGLMQRLLTGEVRVNI